MRSQIAQPNEHFVSDNTYNELFTMHGSTMIYLFVTPMAIALAIYLVPLQIGADRDRPAPRLTLTGFWIWLCGGLIMESSWLTAEGAGRAGWFSYTPLSNGTNTPGVGQDLWTMGVIARRPRDVGDGGVPGRDDRPPPRARDVAAAHAGVHLDRARQHADGRGRVPGADRGDGAAVHRPPRRRTSTRASTG